MKAILLASFIFFKISLAAGQPEPVTLTGMIIVNQGDTIPYTLVLHITNDQIKGYSITYATPYETKTKVEGILDRDRHILSFKETEIVSIHGYHTGPSLCLIKASLAASKTYSGNTLTGAITSMERDNTACGRGQIIFADPAQVNNLFSLHEKYDTVISMKRKGTAEKATAVPETALQPMVMEKITKGEEKSYEWHTDTVVIDIWDGGNVDGDAVTVEFNGKTCLSTYFLVKDKKQLKLPLAPGKINTLIIHADNEGSDPPNTANLLLTDGARKYSVLAYNKKGQSAMIKIRHIDTVQK